MLPAAQCTRRCIRIWTQNEQSHDYLQIAELYQNPLDFPKIKSLVYTMKPSLESGGFTVFTGIVIVELWFS